MGGDLVRDGLDTVLGGVYPFRYLPAEFYSEICRGKGIGRNGRTFPLVGRVGTHTHVDNDTSEGEVDSADYETRDSGVEGACAKKEAWRWYDVV